MRHLWGSVALLAGMIGLLLWNGGYITDHITPLSEQLTEAAQAVRRGEWSQAEQLSGQVKEQWELRAERLRLVQCHTDLDEVTVLLDEAALYLSEQDTEAYLVAVTRITGRLNGIQAWEMLSLSNIF